MPKKRTRQKKYVDVVNILNLNVQDVVKYIHKLHQHIAKQNKKINRLKLKIKKLKFLSQLDAQIAKSSTKLSKDDDETKNQEIASKLTTADSKQQQGKQENVLDFVNEIKAQALVNSFEQAGFIYEPTSGLYYDTKSKFYYNPEYDLYYNGNDGNWYRLNPRTDEFIFHSGTEASAVNKKEETDEDEAIKKILEEGRKPIRALETSKTEEKSERKSRRRDRSTSSSYSSDYSEHRSRRSYKNRSRSRSRKRRSRHRRSRSFNREEGEIATSEESESDSRHQEVVKEKFKRKRKKKKGNEYEEIAKKYPPSLRLMVIESDKMDAGKLFVVTFKGGTLGREGNHDVLIPDVNVSKYHLKFIYNHKKSIYQIIDRSRNGTMLNDIQISLLNQKESDAKDLHHESVLQLAKTKLLCHVHEGLTTCIACEPYGYTKKMPEDLKVVDEPQPSTLSHKEQLKLLQKRYGLETEKYHENPTGTKNKNYEDRAEKRRVKVGSSHHGLKTEQASVNKSISSENKGFKLLSKMGWSEGKSIGKSQEGIKEPVEVKTQQGTSGLGCEVVQPSINFQGNAKKQVIWNKTQERYNNISKPEGNIFGDDEDI
ncbi:CLUMA_CG013506, isoform A [Clunio marinus]|uniref:CLUMA_CG013506, isoform A n=1 Tax=Clunio marinus TaxID=568069 RepID=A0A1J1IP21_9DIPT|nr:CLUMA_CG013506, isoform A [Clunio marinus]